jgi:hypothetical protein
MDPATACRYRVIHLVNEDAGFLDAPPVRLGDALLGEEGQDCLPGLGPAGREGGIGLAALLPGAVLLRRGGILSGDPTQPLPGSQPPGPPP